jgi:hypothetical protein
MKTEKETIHSFWMWLIRTAKVEVADAENAIEVYSLEDETTGLTPVLTFDQLYELYEQYLINIDSKQTN